MAVFTYIATTIVTYVTGAAVVAGTWAAFAVSVIATGLAAVTSRLINGTGRRGGGGPQEQGVRVQLPPNTEYKVPIVYGTAFQQGIITDARISDDNQTMTYVITLSEKTDTGSWTVGDIYWNDQRLNFYNDGYTVQSASVGGTTSTNLDNLVKVAVYAGGSSSTYQIKGPTTATAAYTILNTSSDYAMSDLVFGVVQLTYNSEKGVTGLPTMTFQITNSCKNPGDVWWDYMTNSRYGAGFTSTDVDSVSSYSTTTSTSLWSISNEIPPNQFERWPSYDATSTGTTASTQVRYEINGVLSTGESVKTNLEKINLASASFTTFDHKSGKWKIVPNRAINSTETALCYVFNDDNIIGDIQLTATNLEDLYNSVEVAYANKVVRDQTDYYKFALPSQDLNTLEPANKLQMQASLVNNYIHAGRLGNIELLGSRRDLVISFQADYEALTVEAGDIVKVTNSTYGFTDKLFRVTRMRETEGEDGSLVSEVTAIEYSTATYVDSTLTDLSITISSGIPPAVGSQGLPAPSAPTTGTINFYTFEISTIIDSTSLPVDEVEFFYNTTSTGSFSYLVNVPASGQFYANDTVTGLVTSLSPGTYYFKARTRLNESYSDLSASSAAFDWAPIYDFGGGP